MLDLDNVAYSEENLAFTMHDIGLGGDEHKFQGKFFTRQRSGVRQRPALSDMGFVIAHEKAKADRQASMRIFLRKELVFGTERFPARYYIVPYAVHPDHADQSVDLPIVLNANAEQEFELMRCVEGREVLYHPNDCEHTEVTISEHRDTT